MPISMPCRSLVAPFLDLVQYPERTTTRYQINRCNHHRPEEVFGITTLMKEDRRQEKHYPNTRPDLGCIY